MERHQRELEADAGEQKREAGIGIDVGGGRGVPKPAECCEGHGAVIQIDQRHAEEQEGGRDAGEDEIFKPGLQRALALPGIGDEADQPEAQRLQPEEEGGEMQAGEQGGGAKGGEQQEQVIFVVRPVMHAFQVAVGEQQHGERRGENEEEKEQRVAVDQEERGEGDRADRPGDRIAASEATSPAAVTLAVRRWSRRCAISSITMTGVAARMRKGRADEIVAEIIMGLRGRA